jgi:hypothetical protein
MQTRGFASSVSTRKPMWATTTGDSIDLTDRIALSWRCFILISALSTFDGCALDNHGINGYGELGFGSGEGA